MIPVYEDEDGKFYFEDSDGFQVGPFTTRNMAEVAYNRQAGCKTGSCED